MSLAGALSALAFLSSLTTLIAMPATASAMTVTPVHLEIVSAGSANRGQITVINNSDRPLPIEAVMMAATFDETGAPKTSIAGDDFLIMPPMALIPPRAMQNFRIQWLGDPLIEKSRSFLLYLNQVPVKAPRRQSAVQVVMSMGVLINVAPPQGKPHLEIVETGITTTRKGVRNPTITVRNPSKVHALLPQSTISLAGGNWSRTLAAGTLTGHIGIGLVQPGQRRKFILPVELPAHVPSVRAQLDFRPQR